MLFKETERLQIDPEQINHQYRNGKRIETVLVILDENDNSLKDAIESVVVAANSSATKA